MIVGSNVVDLKKSKVKKSTNSNHDSEETDFGQCSKRSHIYFPVLRKKSLIFLFVYFLVLLQTFFIDERVTDTLILILIQ